MTDNHLYAVVRRTTIIDLAHPKNDLAMAPSTNPLMAPSPTVAVSA
jgi:hypothetical protein